MWIFTQTQENGLKRTDFGGAEAMAQNVKSASLQAWHAEHAEQDLQSQHAYGRCGQKLLSQLTWKHTAQEKNQEEPCPR